jgi:integrase
MRPNNTSGRGASSGKHGATRKCPHVLRHSAARELLQAGVDRALNALWLGHESVETNPVYFAQRSGFGKCLSVRSFLVDQST